MTTEIITTTAVEIEDAEYLTPTDELIDWAEVIEVAK